MRFRIGNIILISNKSQRFDSKFKGQIGIITLCETEYKIWFKALKVPNIHTKDGYWYFMDYQFKDITILDTKNNLARLIV